MSEVHLLRPLLPLPWVPLPVLTKIQIFLHLQMSIHLVWDLDLALAPNLIFLALEECLAEVLRKKPELEMVGTSKPEVSPHSISQD